MAVKSDEATLAWAESMARNEYADTHDGRIIEEVVAIARKRAKFEVENKQLKEIVAKLETHAPCMGCGRLPGRHDTQTAGACSDYTRHPWVDAVLAKPVIKNETNENI